MKSLLDLSQLAPGERARVLGVTSQGAMRRRMGGMSREKPPGRSRRLSGAGRCDRTAAG